MGDDVELEDKLFLIRFTPDEKSHLVVTDPKVCRQRCAGKNCTAFCPAGVYKWMPKEQLLIVSYEDCVECGACRISCPFGNVDWRYPRGGYGVSYKYG